MLLQKVADKVQKAEELCSEIVSQRKIKNALNTLLRADESGDLDEDTKKELEPIVAYTLTNRAPETEETYIRITPFYKV